MILDGLLQFSLAAGDVPTVSATSGNILDLHLVGIPVLAANQGARDLGIGDDPAMKLLVLVTTAFAGLTSLQVSLQGAPDNGAGAPAAFVTWYSSPVVALANLVVGNRLLDMDMPRPPPGQPIPRFLQLAYTIVGTASGGGTLKSWIVLDRHDLVYNATSNFIHGGYPPGVVVNN
jgi:hypothetical protein